MVKTTEQGPQQELEQHLHDAETPVVPTSSADMGSSGVASVLRRVESAYRGALSTAAAWAVRAREAIATMAHTTAAFAGFA